MGTNTTSFYLDPPQLIGRPNNDGTVTLTPLELKKLNDFNYAVSKMLQGNLNLANLNSDTQTVFSDLEGNVTTVTETAAGLAVDVQDLENRNTVTINANGLYVTDKNGNTTQLSGDHIKSGTIEGVELISRISSGSSTMVVIQDGEIMIGSSAYGANIKYDGSKVYFDCVLAPLKIETLANMSIEAGGTLYINTNGGDTQIGNSGSTLNLQGDVYIGGTPIDTYIQNLIP